MNYFDYMEAMATLEQYLRRAGECEKLPALSQDRRDAVLALNASVPGVNAILASLAPDSGQISAGSVEDHRRGLLLVEEAHELLEEARELLTGIEALRLITEMDEEDHDEHGPFGFLKLSDLPLDPAVTQAAQDHWSGAKYRSAVVDAANAVAARYPKSSVHSKQMPLKEG